MGYYVVCKKSHLFEVQNGSTLEDKCRQKARNQQKPDALPLAVVDCPICLSDHDRATQILYANCRDNGCQFDEIVCEYGCVAEQQVKAIARSRYEGQLIAKGTASRVTVNDPRPSIVDQIPDGDS